MSRYIDADKIDYTMASVYWGKDNKGRDTYRRTFVAFKSDIDELPTADVVEVVRCKDCKHNVANWHHDELDAEDYTDIVCDYFMTDGMEANDYCSRRERKDDGK